VSRVTDPLLRGESVVAAEAALPAAAADVLLDAAPRRQAWWAPVLSYVVTVFLLLTINFAVPRLMPGDPIQALLAFGNPNYVQNDQDRAKLAHYYKLDKPVSAQYGHYLAGLAHGDLGVSIISHHPVSQELGIRVKWSLLLIVSAAAISLLMSIPPGVHSGWKRGKRLDRRLLIFFVTAQNVPTFLIAFVAVITLAAHLGIFPLGGATTAFSGYTGVLAVLDVLHHLALPALVMAFFDFATYQYLMTRSSMVSELGADYLLVGRAKGLRERRLKYRHAGRNAMLPVVTVIGLNISLAITIIVVTERIFGYPGVGAYMFDAIGTRDYPALQGSFLLLTLAVVTINLVVDLLYRRIDPRTAA
jgi:peptide/nickel transport system permease protein